MVMTCTCFVKNARLSSNMHRSARESAQKRKEHERGRASECMDWWVGGERLPGARARS